VVHRNPPLTETGRLRLARCIVEHAWPVARAAERSQVGGQLAQPARKPATWWEAWAGPLLQAGLTRDARPVAAGYT
jgi:hypothetical protein